MSSDGTGYDVHKMMEGVVVDDDTLALEAVEAVGLGGNFLAQRHTRTHIRDLWLSNLVDRRAYDVWEDKRDGARDWACDRARQILSTRQLAPLDGAISREFDRVIETMENK